MENYNFDKFGLKPIQFIELKVIVYSFDSQAKRKEIVRRVMKVESFDLVPFNSIIQSFQFLYPKCFVEFSTQL